MAKKTFKERIDQNIGWLKKSPQNFKNEIKSGIEPLMKELTSKVCEEHGLELIEYSKLLEDHDKSLSEQFNRKYKPFKDSNKAQSTNTGEVASETSKITGKYKKDFDDKHNIQSKPDKSNKSAQDNVLLKNLDTKLHEIFESIKSIKNTNIESKLNLLKEDIKFEISKQMKDSLKDTSEAVDMLPAQLDNISKEIANIELSTSSSKILDIPTDEQAIVELAKFMQDGLKQFENISRYYVQNQSKIEKSDKNSTKATEVLDKEKSESFEKGKKEERTRLAKKIYADFPDKFAGIQPVFDDLIDEKHKRGEKIIITVDNRKEYELSIKGILGEGEIEIDNSDLLIDGEIVRLATIKKGK